MMRVYGLMDGVEVETYGTNPIKSDTDDDEIEDYDAKADYTDDEDPDFDFSDYEAP